jgi:antirestriction protein ArdC
MGSFRLSPFFAVNQRMETAMQSIKDTYQRITDTIVEQLEVGTKPWIRPWRGNTRRSSIIPRRATGEAYRGINVIMLWVAGQMFGYEENTWMTYRQAQDLGGQVRKGEKGSLVVKYGTFTPKDREDDEDRAIPYLKGYTVFNVEQMENLPDRFYSPAEELSCRQRRFRISRPSKPSSKTPAQSSAMAARKPATDQASTTFSYRTAIASTARFTSTRLCSTRSVIFRARSIALTEI